MRSLIATGLILAVVSGVTGCSAPHDNVTAQERQLIHESLKGPEFAALLGGAPSGTTVGCAEHVMGASRHGSRVRVYVYLACGAWRAPRCAITDGPEGSFPAVATVRATSVSWQAPGDGNQYVHDID